jgi:hypothetical protein
VVVNGQFTSAKTDQGHWNFQVSQLQENISKISLITLRLKISGLYLQPLWELSSAGSEHLPYKQGVAGSNPAVPTDLQTVTKVKLVTVFFICIKLTFNKGAGSKWNITCSRVMFLFENNT